MTMALIQTIFNKTSGDAKVVHESWENHGVMNTAYWHEFVEWMLELFQAVVFGNIKLWGNICV